MSHFFKRGKIHLFSSDYFCHIGLWAVSEGYILVICTAWTDACASWWSLSGFLQKLPGHKTNWSFDAVLHLGNFILGTWCYFAVKLNQPLYCAFQNSTDQIPQFPKPVCPCVEANRSASVSPPHRPRVPSLSLLPLNYLRGKLQEVYTAHSSMIFNLPWYDFVQFVISSQTFGLTLR